MAQEQEKDVRMSQFIVSKIAASKDGSSMGPSVVMVTADSAAEAKTDGAAILNTLPHNVKVVNFDTFDSE